MPNSTIPATSLSPTLPTPVATPKIGKSKHLILILLIVFPPLAWYYMWKEDRYHNWFASVLIIDGLIFIATAILLLATIYPPITQLFTAVKAEHPTTAKIMPYLFIALGIIEVAYGLYLRIKTHHLPLLPKKLLVLVIILLSIHFVGLPLGQALSYVDLISKLYNTNLNQYAAIPRPRQYSTPTPTQTWKSYTDTNLKFTISYPSNWTYDKFEGSNGLVLKPLNDKKYAEKYNGVITVGPGGFGTEKITSFENWIRTKGNQEIQGLGTINTLTPITTTKGAQGYRVVWNIEPGSPSTDTTMLIYYFQTPGSTTSSYIRITPNNPKYESIINQIIDSFSFTITPTITTTIIPTRSTKEPVMCTMDAKLCPDGTSVGRTGPNCEFSACP